ncbi:toprim domain-containing protein [Erythrobacter sp. sf7]|uniref:Toprim domain-containing protein n=1 Tax=Erythrobacter fulvus TaxID=2987523 RepID=A0ABT5JKS1_9SPHN|nr:toprim domain-containing protein [Erythrobacter fulvus]MDC8753323.1 toprim domain-containing protein [Erythrobacter fulvus]
MSDLVSTFIEAMQAAGIRPLEPIAHKLAAGQPVRFRAEGDRPGRRNGWAVLHLDGVPAGVFRHYRLGIRSIWRAGSDPRALAPAERRAIMAKANEAEARRKAETRAKQDAAAKQAQALWKAAISAEPAHGYLTAKSLAPFGIRQSGTALLVPMFDPAFRLWNLQRIAPDGGKRFLSGGRIEGLFWPHAMHLADGRPSPGPLVIGEGFATVAAIHEATGHAVAAAMSARNLEPVARAMRGLFPARQIIIAADNDCHLAENMGLRLARKAAESIGGLLAIPRPETSRGNSGADFADLRRNEAAAIIAATLRGEA